ncbi:thiolase family protein [Paraherbaspirillum soli]|uniref:Thiolase family protein n=1 Tax=Paraherbaspirillum soli TaxID=631222 RepID=A0ABW0MF37_9BURK
MLVSPVIAGFARSPFHFARKGALIGMRPDDIAAQVVKGLIERLDVDPALIEDVIAGCAYPEGEQGDNIARIVGLLAGLPQSVAGMTINRFCGSSMSAVHMAAASMQMGAGEAFLCIGVESMTRVPNGGFHPAPNLTLLESRTQAYVTMGQTAENVATQYRISRADQELLAAESHRKAATAQDIGHFEREIVPIKTADGIVTRDGCIRANTTPEILANLKPAFDPTGSVTAGTSSPLTDGATALLVCSEQFAQRHKLDIFARIKAVAVAGCPPEIMGMGPVYATRKALQRAGLSMADIDVIELNEAFASQAVACIRELGMDASRVNVDGGAIALGHPLGATGARITGKAADILKRQGGRYALATQCIGGGQGIATILESV